MKVSGCQHPPCWWWSQCEGYRYRGPTNLLTRPPTIGMLLCWRMEAAVMPLHLRRFHRVLSQNFVDVLALGAFESPQIGAVRTSFDPGQHHAALTPRAAWPFDRKQRWIGAGIGLGHVDAPADQGGATLRHR